MRMHPIGRRLLLLAVVVLAFAAPAAAQRRLLYIDYVGPGAHDHPSRVNARAAMQAIAQSGGMTVQITSDVASVTAQTLAQYDAVVFFTCGDSPGGTPLRFALL